MKRTNNKTQVDRRMIISEIREAERQKRTKIALLSLLTLVVASALLLGAAILEIHYSSSHLYIWGKERQRIDNDLVLTSDGLLADMNAAAELCGIERTYFFSQAIYNINGTRAIFEDGSSTAVINGLSVELPTAATVTEEYCLIPLSTLASVIPGLKIVEKEDRTTVSIESNKIFLIAPESESEYLTDVSEYLDCIRSTDDYIFTLANKEHPVERDEPEGLVLIPEKYRASGRAYYLYSVAEGALVAMMNDMFAAGYDDVYVTSAYRSYEYQENLFNGYIDTEMKQNSLSYAEAREKVLTYSSEPGKSEHQTGLCVDFTTSSIGGAVDDIFATTEVFRWLKENAWRYGFIMRYPEDKVDITGYAYESWHYRFVGIDAASIIHQCGMCYEEYLENFVK